MAAAAAARSRSRILCLAVSGIVVLALALGVGLGVGLKHHHAASHGLKASNTSTSTTNTTSSLLSLTSQDSSAFFLRGGAAMAAEPAQDRIYSFVLEERLGSPDGVEKTMLVVNGLYPGEFRRWQVRDVFLPELANQLLQVLPSRSTREIESLSTSPTSCRTRQP